MTIYLQHLIVEHQKLFKSFYRDRNVIAKHHYPSSIRKADPLLHMCLRGSKGKHDMFKTLFKPFKANLEQSVKASACCSLSLRAFNLKQNEFRIRMKWWVKSEGHFAVYKAERVPPPFFSLFSPRFLFLFSFFSFAILVWTPSALPQHPQDNNMNNTIK